MDCVGAAAAKEGPTLPRGMSGRGASAAGSYPVPPKPVGASDFSVMSYNILAQKNINKHRHLYPSVSPHILSWNYRMDTFVSEVRHLMPDVLCLQEVDHFKDIEVRLGRLGYSGSFLQRTGGCDDGCAIFFKSAMFSLQQQVPIRFNALGLRDNVALICVLQRKSPGGDAEFGPERLIVSNTHILFNPRRGEIKLAQVRTLLMAVHRLKEQCEKPCKHSGTQGIGRRTHAVVVGDWNCSPSSPLYRYIRHGTLDLSTTDRRNLAGHMEGSGRRTLQARIDSYVQQGRTSIVGRPGTDEWRTFTATPSKDELSRKYAEEEERFWANQKAVDSRFTDKPSEQGSSFNGAGSKHNRQLHCSIFGSTALEGRGWDRHHLETAVGCKGSHIASHPLKLYSAYGGREEGEPEYTSYHDRFFGTVDYVWHTPCLQPTRSLGMLPLLTLKQLGCLPAIGWPSDHLSLFVEFKILEDPE